MEWEIAECILMGNFALNVCRDIFLRVNRNANKLNLFKIVNTMIHRQRLLYVSSVWINFIWQIIPVKIEYWKYSIAVSISKIKNYVKFVRIDFNWNQIQLFVFLQLLIVWHMQKIKPKLDWYVPSVLIDIIMMQNQIDV